MRERRERHGTTRESSGTTVARRVPGSSEPVRRSERRRTQGLGSPASGSGTSYGGYTVNPAGDQTVTYSIETLLAKVFTKGATLAGQVPAGTAQFARFDGTNPGWDWRYTRMFLDLEHEVAPNAQAIGAGGDCTACHGASPVIPICELYAGVPANALAWGVTCP